MSDPVARREALRRLALGSAAVAAPAWVEGLSAFAGDHAHVIQRTAKAATAWKPKVLTPAQNRHSGRTERGDHPQTDTPGAKAANVNQFIDGVLAEAPTVQRDGFLAGLAWVDARAQKEYSKPFADASPAHQAALLTSLSAPGATEGADRAGAEFFLAIKSMTITGYYTSEAGARSELGDDGTRSSPSSKAAPTPSTRGRPGLPVGRAPVGRAPVG